MDAEDVHAATLAPQGLLVGHGVLLGGPGYF